MTQITRAAATIDAIKGSLATSPQKIRIADAFMAADPFSLIQTERVKLADPINPTPAEKAKVFNITMRKYLREILRSHGEKKARDNSEKSIKAAGAKAADDV